MARRMLTAAERRNGTSIWDSIAWRARRFAIAKREAAKRGIELREKKMRVVFDKQVWYFAIVNFIRKIFGKKPLTPKFHVEYA